MDHRENNLNNELGIVLRSGAYDGFLRPLGYALSFVSSLILARIVGPSVIGSVGVALSILTIAQNAPGLGLNLGILRKGAGYLGMSDIRNASRTLYLSCICSGIAALVIVIAYFLFIRRMAYGVLEKSVGSIIVFDCLVLLFPVICILPLFQSTFTALQKSYKTTLYDQIIRNVLRLSITVALIFFFSKLFSFVVGTSIGLVGSFLFQGAAIKREMKWRRENGRATNCHAEKSDINIRTLLTYSMPLIIVPFLTTATREMDLWIAGYFRPTGEAGVYVIVRILGGTLLIQLLMFGELFAVSAVKLIHADGAASVSSTFAISAKWISLISGAGFVILFCYSKDILGFFGDAYVAGATVLKVFIVGQLFQSMFGATGTMLLMFDKRRYLIVNSFIMLAFNVGLSLYLTARYGIMGAAASITITNIIVPIIVLIEVIVLLKIAPGSLWDYTKRMLLVLAAIGIASLLGVLFSHLSPLIRVTLSAIIIVSIYGIAARFLENWTDEEKALYSTVRVGVKNKLSGVVARVSG